MKGDFNRIVYPRIKDKSATILWGNGVNNYINCNYSDYISVDDRMPSWKNLILMVSAKSRIDTKLQIDTIDLPDKDVSYPELFSLISRYAPEEVRNLTAEIIIERSRHVNECFSRVAKKIQEWDVPVITTNYDLMLEQELDLENFWHGKERSDKYPFNYYATKKGVKGPINPTTDFAVWHCNGVVNKPISMKLDLSDYCLYTARLRDKVPLLSERFCAKDGFERTWLSPFFHNTLVIIGLGLPTSEFYLRWLLLERSVMKKEIPDQVGKGYYITAGKDDITPGFKAFLGDTSIELIEYDSWKDMYVELFGI